MANTKPVGVAYSDPALVSGTTIDGAVITGSTLAGAAGSFTTLAASATAVLSSNVAIGGTTAVIVGFHGATGAAQATFISAVDGTGIASGLVGFATTAQALTLYAAVNSIRTILINKGLMAAS